MTIATLPNYYDMIFSDIKTGKLSNQAQLFMDQAFQTLNDVVNEFNNGIIMPSFTSAEITTLKATADLGTVYFNTDLAKLQVVVAANTVETITST
ncbi:MAG: hypothetical protein P4L35_10915 [Ignavibacteriaceae bacterium]|nr:hypothetical protein [Ignavibacteriaceae bacterium]